MREEKGMSQRAIAEIFGVSQMTILRWESGGETDFTMLAKICKFFGVTSDYLIGLSDDL